MRLVPKISTDLLLSRTTCSAIQALAQILTPTYSCQQAHICLPFCLAKQKSAGNDEKVYMPIVTSMGKVSKGAHRFCYIDSSLRLRNICSLLTHLKCTFRFITISVSNNLYKYSQLCTTYNKAIYLVIVTYVFSPCCLGLCTYYSE